MPHEGLPVSGNNSPYLIYDRQDHWRNFAEKEADLNESAESTGLPQSGGLATRAHQRSTLLSSLQTAYVDN